MTEPRPPRRRRRRRLRITLAVLGALGALIGVLYLIPGGPAYDPAPLNRSLAASAALGQRELADRPRGPLPPGGGSLLLRNARIVDGTDTPPRAAVALRIRDGRITAIEAEPVVPAAGEVVLDVRGSTVIPGLIDAHVHMAYAPGAALRDDPPETTLALRRQHLRAHLAWGVTTVLDPAVPADVAIETLAFLAAGYPGPRYLHLGPPLSTPGGYLEDLFPPPIATPQQLAERLDQVQQSRAVGVKLTFEPGMIAPIWRLHPEPMLAAIRTTTKERGLPIYAHAMTEPTYRQALALGVHALVHHTETASDDLIRLVRERGTYVITTAAVWDVDRVLLRPELLREPIFERTVPALERATASDPESIYRFTAGMLGTLLPQLPGGVRRLLAIGMRDGSGRRLNRVIEGPRLRHTLATLKRLHQGGVPLVMGTDSGNWPLFPYYFHGPTALLEIELLQRAGLSPHAVLRICTVNGARMLGLQDELGAITVGRRADLLVVEGDPLADLAGALRGLRYVVRDGIAHTPGEWMDL